MSVTDADRVKRLQWRRHPHTQAELLRLATNATRISPRCLPAWVEPADLVRFYVEALRLTRDTGVAHEVDHHFPLLGETVCGLHVPGNLRVIPAAANQAKRNRLPADPETWPPFDVPRPPRRSARRPTNQPYQVMFPKSLVRRRSGRK